LGWEQDSGAAISLSSMVGAISRQAGKKIGKLAAYLQSSEEERPKAPELSTRQRQKSGEQMTQTHLKRQAGEAAVRFVRSGMILGLGHGSTAVWTLRLIAERVRQGLLRDLLIIPCSSQVAADAAQEGLTLNPFHEIPVIDLTIDGADEVDDELNLIKGAGGALLREKIVAQASRREIIVVDDSKMVRQLGSSKRVPVEIMPFGLACQLVFLQELGADVRLRQGPGPAPFRSDGGNFIADCDFGPLPRPQTLASALDNRAGIAGHGLFLGLVSDLIIADAKGCHHRQARTPQEEEIR
jgi:ribose 5-phosphate isomerase A